MSQLKLTADGGGGTVAIKGPASTTGNNAFELTVPGTASGTILTSNSSVGKILQVKQATKTDIASLSTTSFTEITDFTQTITTVAGSKVYAQGHFYMGAPAAYNVFIRLVRVDADGSTNYPYLGDASGLAFRATAGGLCQNYNYGEINTSFMFLDTPSGAGTHTYKIEWRAGYTSTTVYLGRTDYGSYDSTGLCPSSFTIMEVAA